VYIFVTVKTLENAVHFPGHNTILFKKT